MNIKVIASWFSFVQERLYKEYSSLVLCVIFKRHNEKKINNYLPQTLRNVLSICPTVRKLGKKNHLKMH
jgi:hypothetical protein